MGRILAGIPRLGPDESRPLTPISTLTAMLRSLGLNTSYDELMFLGGGAFRTAWSERWTPEAAFACSEDIVAKAARTQGCTTATKFHSAPGEAWETIVASIEAGVPLVTCGLLSRNEWTIIVGYEEEPRVLFLRDIPTWTPEPVAKAFEAWAGWTYSGRGRLPLMTIKRVDKVMDDRQAAVEALERAVRFSLEEQFGWPGEDGLEWRFNSGMKAYESLARSAANMAEGAGGEAMAGRMALSNQVVGAIIDARRSAIERLEIIKGRGSRQIYDVTVAADRYAREVAVLEQGLAIGGHDILANSVAAAGEEDLKAAKAISRVLSQL